ncbi:MAG TPA: putative DNA modification/repair radical SAM protein [Alphaproteobacteria bacterium]|jgi:putative DNA modification/repair radical SAM protein|nr:putative DNA modification/repair radical SAM protein [Alphaproteobacteria bacterium]
MELKDKLAILADAAKYDASCASSGADKRNSLGGKGIGSTEGMGICHSYTPDGRCVSLLKILLTNACIYDCLYCINRSSSNVRRARFSVDEVVRLTLSFYKRNYIEGLFLSSGIIKSPDYTMEALVAVVRTLREVHDFRGYIHLKTIPNADERLLALAGQYADRVSVNVELPTTESLNQLAPRKDIREIRRAMGQMRGRIDEAKAEKKAPRFAPAGQSTQLIVGADAANDGAILGTSVNLYSAYRLRRVYYSAFSPIPDASAFLPLKPAPLTRENRLYQADWLLRYYGFGLDEIVAGGEQGMLDLEIDPKLAWALKHRERFPLDINLASREELLRVPGLGVRNVDRILASRRVRQLRLDDLARLRVPLKKAKPFIVLPDHRPTHLLELADLRSLVRPKPAQQLTLGFA